MSKSVEVEEHTFCKKKEMTNNLFWQWPRNTMVEW